MEGGIRYRRGVGVIKPNSSVPLFSEFCGIVKTHVSYCCGDTCQIWMWFEEFNMYFCHIENFAYGEINEWSFSNPHPRQASDRTKGSFQYKSGHSKCGNYHWYKTRLPLYMHRLMLILEILILYWQGSINIIQPRVERNFLTFKVLEISKLSSKPSYFLCRISYMTQFNSLAWRWKRKLAYRYIFPCPCFIQVSLWDANFTKRVSKQKLLSVNRLLINHREKSYFRESIYPYMYGVHGPILLIVFNWDYGMDI